MVAGAIYLLALHRIGTIVLILALGVVAAAVLLERPRWAVGVAISLAVLCESGTDTATPFTARLYTFVPGVKVAGIEVLVVLAAAAVLLDVDRRRQLRMPTPITLGLVLVGLALVGGTVTGLDAGVGATAMLSGVRTIILLLLMPVLVANVVHSTADLHRAMAITAGLTAAKCAAGILFLFSGLTPSGGTGPRLAYYEPTPNFLPMLVLVGVLAIVVSRAALPRLVRFAVPLTFASLLLSYRRSFWIATVAAGLLTVLLGSGRVGRRLLLPAGAVVGVAVYLALSSGAPVQLGGSVGQRIQQLRPSSIRANAEDRYRLTEQRNVRAALGRAPLTGLGIGVPWPVRYPLSLEHPDGETYVHFALLWWWLKLGLLGLIAYVALSATAIVSALRSFARHHDPLVRAGCLGAAMSLLGLQVAETTATFEGTDVRMSIVIGALLGLIAVAARTRDDAPRS